MSPARRDVNQVAGYPMNRRHVFRVLGMAAVLFCAGCSQPQKKLPVIPAAILPPIPTARAKTAFAAPPPPVSSVFALAWECYEVATNGTVETIIESSADLIHWKPFAAVPIFAVSNSLPITNAGGTMFFRAFNREL